jgi:hypothetical protein
LAEGVGWGRRGAILFHCLSLNKGFSVRMSLSQSSHEVMK